jgi:hypothetical protein
MNKTLGLAAPRCAAAAALSLSSTPAGATPASSVNASRRVCPSTDSIPRRLALGVSGGVVGPVEHHVLLDLALEIAWAWALSADG